MTVTSVRKVSAEHYSVTVDGEEIASTLGAITDMRIFAEKEISGEQLTEFKLLSARYLALEKAVEILSRRQMSSGELKKKLSEKKFEEDICEYCSAWAQRNGFIDDARYAEVVVKHYSQKGFGPAKIKAELSKRLVNREFWEDALNSQEPDTSVIDRLVSSKIKDPDDKNQIMKVSAFLQRRGFTWEEIKEAIERNRYLQD